VSKEKIIIADGGGGEKTRQLLGGHILPRFNNRYLDLLGDSAVLPSFDGPLCMTTDSYVVDPIEFPGGDIGRLAVCGTVNDLACEGGIPQWLSMGLIIEEGLEIEVLDRVLESAAAAADEAKVQVVAGDTKVIERRGGQISSLMINTTGIGSLRANIDLDPGRIVPGDGILINGNIADHGISVMSAREGLEFETAVRSDVAPLSALVFDLFDSCIDIKFLRDPTRSGLAGVIADLVENTGMTVELDESSIPVSRAAAGAADILGLDPMNIANEGKIVVVTAEKDRQKALAVMRANRYGRNAAAVGRFTSVTPPVAELVTSAGGRRVINRPYGEELPRIC